MNSSSHSPIPAIAQHELFPENVAIDIQQPEQIDGNISLLELTIISRLIRILDPTVLFEIGTFDGRTTLNMAHHSRPDAKVYTLNLPKENAASTKFPLYQREDLGLNDRRYTDKAVSGARYIGEESSAKIHQLLGDSATFDFSKFNNNCDFVFVDGSHAKDYVQNDTEIAFRLLQNGKGSILWHDYGVWGDVTDVLDDKYRSDPRFKNSMRIEGTCFVYLKNE